MSAMGTANAARGRWPGILQAHGIDPKFLRDIHGPCPICGGKDRFRFDDKLNGNWFCTHCGAGDGVVLLEKFKGWSTKQALDEVDRVVGHAPLAGPAKPERSEDDKRKYMRLLYKESRPVTPGDPVWTYLERRCGDPSGVLQDIRYHPALKHPTGGRYPAMLAFMGWDPVAKRFSGIHRTYLTDDGRKAQVDPVRMSYGDLGAVRLGPIQGHLGVAEGIETAICAGRIFGLPVWSAICANGLMAWDPPTEVKAVTVFGDNDASYAGQAAAYELARKLVNRGFDVKVEIPPTVGTDWADVFSLTNKGKCPE